jgi:hypothetical protein
MGPNASTNGSTNWPRGTENYFRGSNNFAKPMLAGACIDHEGPGLQRRNRCGLQLKKLEMSLAKSKACTTNYGSVSHTM